MVVAQTGWKPDVGMVQETMGLGMKGLGMKGLETKGQETKAHETKALATKALTVPTWGDLARTASRFRADQAASRARDR